MNFRTDLALERRELIKDSVPDGVDFEEKIDGDIKITRIKIVSPEGERALSKPRGNYITVELPKISGLPNESEKEIEIISKEISALVGNDGCVLVVGLGNRDITPDNVGPKTIDFTLATRHIADKMPELNFRSVAAISPGVMGQTGIETSEIVKSVCDRIKPSAVIVVDALAAKSVHRLLSTVQISDTGITPGSGVNNARAELSQNTLGVKTIAVGVPTVVDAVTVACECMGEMGKAYIEEEKFKSLMVTPREIDSKVTAISRTLALSIGRALQPDLETLDLYFLSV